MSPNAAVGASADLAVSVKDAWAAVADADLPDAMQKVAFKEALRAALGTAQRPQAESSFRSRQVSVEAPAHAEEGTAAEPPTLEEAEVLRKVSEETDVALEDLERVLNIDGGTIRLLGSHAKYGSGVTEQARTVAQIVTVVRKLGMAESDTPYEIIKAACESKHCYDSTNFASKHLPNIPGFVVRGEGPGRRLEARGQGLSAFPGLIDKVLGKA